MRLDATDPRADVLELSATCRDAEENSVAFTAHVTLAIARIFPRKLIVIESVLHLARNQATMTPAMMMTTPSDAGLIVGTK